MTGSQLRALVIVAALLGALGGCGGRAYYSEIPEPVAPAPAQPATPQPSPPQGYVVRRGDTLYSIAFSVGKDWREVAASNGIAAPYTIYPGQVLQLGAAAPARAAPPVQTPSLGTVRAQPAPDSGAIVAPVTAAPETGKAADAGPASPPAAPAVASPAVPAPGRAAAQPATVAVVPPAPRESLKPGAWHWPAAGKLLRRFSAGSQPHKGVDIDGRSGDPVHAANNGTVVYAGNGVRGYGNLLIVKHDETFLSAYAHNSKLLVKEGDVVRGGEKIAEIGDSGTDRVQLHFEVRRQGNPVDPLKILPRR